jgi:ATP-dependent Clp protease ATP-binding subunit ClpA
MEAVDSGQQQASKIGPDGQRFYDLSKCLFLFTSNLDLSDTPVKNRIGFRPETAPDPAGPSVPPADLSMRSRIIADNDAAKRSLLKKGLYPPEVIARFTAFVRFLPLTGNDVMELVIQKLSETAYDQHALCLSSVSPEIVQDLYDICAPLVPKSGVRVIQMAIDIYLGEAMMHCSHHSAEYAAVSLEGTLEEPRLIPDPPADS